MNIHKEFCPINLSLKGQWSASIEPYCNCELEFELATFGCLDTGALTIGCWECGESINRENVKAFISELLAQELATQKEKILKVVEGMKKSIGEPHPSLKGVYPEMEFDAGQKHALTQALEEIKKICS